MGRDRNGEGWEWGETGMGRDGNGQRQEEEEWKGEYREEKE